MRARARDLPSFLVRSRTLFLSSFSLSLSFSHARTHTHSLSARASGVTLRKRKREKRRRTQKITHAEIFFSFFFFFFLANSGSRCSLHAIIYTRTKILLRKNERTQEKHTNDDAFPTTSSRGVLLRALVVLEKQRLVRAVFVFFFFDVHAFFWFRGERKRKRRDGNETTLFRVLR